MTAPAPSTSTEAPTNHATPTGLVMRNLFYILRYVFVDNDRHHALGFKPPESLTLDKGYEAQSLYPLLAAWFAETVGTMIKQGLYRHYRTHVETCHGVKGKLLMKETMTQQVKNPHKTVCAVDNFTANVLQNQVLYATVCGLLKHEDASNLEASLQHALRHIQYVLAEATHNARVLALHQVRWQSLYPPKASVYLYHALWLCEVFASYALPDPEDATLPNRHTKRKDITSKSKKEEEALFESFLRGWLKHHYPAFSPSSKTLSWQLTSDNKPSELPQMKTDILLKLNPTHSLIIDAKYYTRGALVKSHRGDKKKYYTNNLYQMYAYMDNHRRSQEAQIHAPHQVTGLLLYAQPETVEEASFEPVPWQVGTLHVAHLNLNQPHTMIDEALKTLLSTILQHALSINPQESSVV
jgi:5-methylcytosine-specific restriction endonuclease McrBC regulatory subunit McrC